MLLKIFLLLELVVNLWFVPAFAKRCPRGSVPTATNKTMCYTWTKQSSGDLPATYANAEIACNKKGGHLASIHNQMENDYLYELLTRDGSSTNYWIGINGVDKKWVWVDGTPVNYLNWHLVAYDYVCGFFGRYGGKWFPSECETLMDYICMIPTKK